MNQIKNIAILFDMDGVIVNNNPYHKKAWNIFCDKYNFKLAGDDFEKYIWGKTNEHILQYLFGDSIEQCTIKKYSSEKEALYRQIHEPEIVPINGLKELLEQFKNNNIKCAIGTSAPPENVEFVIDKTNIKQYFNAIVDESKVSNGKPDPEIYLKAASLLRILPENCLVFEDSFIGIEAARRAGMKVVGLTTTHNQDELINRVDYVIDDYTQIDISKIQAIVQNN